MEPFSSVDPIARRGNSRGEETLGWPSMPAVAFATHVADVIADLQQHLETLRGALAAAGSVHQQAYSGPMPPAWHLQGIDDPIGGHAG